MTRPPAAVRADWQRIAAQVPLAPRSYATDRHALSPLPRPAGHLGTWSDGALRPVDLPRLTIRFEGPDAVADVTWSYGTRDAVRLPAPTSADHLWKEPPHA